MYDVLNLALAATLSIMFIVDIILKFKKGFLLEKLRDWGFLSPVYLCFMGGLSIYIVGFVGWLLLVVSALVSTNLVRFRHVIDLPNAQDDAVARNCRLLQSLEIQAYALVVSELICCGFVVTKFFGFSCSR